METRPLWGSRDYALARSKSEVLLLAALDYSRERHVVYAAARLGKKIIYLPLGSLSPVKLKRLRVFHVLYGNDKREIAREYIW